MGYPLRDQRPESVYRVRCCGVDGTAIFQDADDTRAFGELLHDVAERFRWKVLDIQLSRAAYELVVEIRAANLARGMQHLNGRYARAFNRRHGRYGHLFARRYESVRIGRRGRAAAFLRGLGRRRRLADAVRAKTLLTSDASGRRTV